MSSDADPPADDATARSQVRLVQIAAQELARILGPFAELAAELAERAGICRALALSAAHDPAEERRLLAKAEGYRHSSELLTGAVERARHG